VRLTHPLNTQLAHTAALWRSVCEPVANWLSQSLGRLGGTGAVLAGNRKINVVQTMSSKLLGQGREPNPLTPLPAFSGPPHGRMPLPMQGTLKDNPVPLACWECGKVLAGKRRRLCSNECARTFPVDQVGAPVIPAYYSSGVARTAKCGTSEDIVAVSVRPLTHRGTGAKQPATGRGPASKRPSRWAIRT
jgi:hypothetical protein